MIVENLATNPSFEAASGVVTVRTNLCTNPRVGVDLSTISATSSGAAPTLSRVATGGPTGTATFASATAGGALTHMQVGWVGAGTNLVTPALRYTASGSMRSSLAATVNLYLEFYDAGGAIVGSVTFAGSISANAWSRYSVDGTAPAGAVRAGIFFRGTAAYVLNSTLDATAVLVEQSPVLGTYLDGATPAGGDFTYAWTGTADASTSVQRGSGVATMSGSQVATIQSTEWAATGVKSARIIPTTTSTASRSGFTIFSGLTVGATYTVVGTVRVPAALTGTLDAKALGIEVGGVAVTYLPGFAPPANAVVVAQVRATFVATATGHDIFFYNGAAQGGGDVWWDAVAVIAGVYTDPYFDGTTASTEKITYTWTGPADASTSRKVTYLDGTNLTIGRFGIDIRVDDVTGWDESGDRITVTGQTPHGSVPDSLTLRQQLMGYVDSPDETFVPVTWADQPEVNGYYRVLSADVSPNPRGAFAGVYDFRVDLVRVRGFTAPMIESVIIGKLRTTPLALTKRPFLAIPAGSRSYVEYYPDTRTLIPSALDVRRAGASSVLNVFRAGADIMVGQFYLPPVKFYEGAATARVGGRVIAGRQAANNTADWQVSNDLIQVEPAAGANLAFRIRMWDNGAWSAWTTATMKWGTDVLNRKPLRFPHTVTILANSPERVAVRLLSTTGSESGGDYSPVSVDITLRRGGRAVSVDVRSVFQSYFAANLTGFTAPTALTGGHSKTTAGITTFIGSASTISVDNGDVYPNQDAVQSVKEYSFGVGLTNAAETAQTLLNEYFWAGSEKQAVVAR